MDNSRKDKPLGALSLWAIGFGAIIGWGWVAMGSYWIGTAGILGTVIMLVCICILMLMISLCYTELTSAMPRAGGPQNFAWRAFGPKMAFVAAWISLFSPITFMSWMNNAMISALDYVFNFSNSPLLYTIAGHEVHLASLIVYEVLGLGMTIIGLLGINVISKVQNLGVISMIVLVVVFVGSAFFKGDAANCQPLMPNGLGGMFTILLTSITFLCGFECVSNSIEDAHVPYKSLGKIIFWVMVASAVWLIVTQLATALALPYDAVINSSLSAFDAMSALFNGAGWTTWVMLAVGLLGIITSWIACSINSSTITYNMARTGMLPEWFTKRNKKYGTPTRIILIIGIIMELLGFLGGAVNILFATTAGFFTCISYTLVCIDFIVLKKKEPNMERPFRTNTWVGIAAVAVGVLLIILALPGMPSGLKWPLDIIVTVVWIAVGVLIYVFYIKKRNRLKTIDDNMRTMLIEDKTL